jgi:hypothetical protein
MRLRRVPEPPSPPLSGRLFRNSRHIDLPACIWTAAGIWMREGGVGVHVVLEARHPHVTAQCGTASVMSKIRVGMFQSYGLSDKKTVDPVREMSRPTRCLSYGSGNPTVPRTAPLLWQILQRTPSPRSGHQRRQSLRSARPRRGTAEMRACLKSGTPPQRGIAVPSYQWTLPLCPLASGS